MAPNVSWITLTSEQQAELEGCVGTAGWGMVPQSQLPIVLPEGLRAKTDSALVIVAPTSTGGTYLVTSTLRVDTKDQAIDQEPFGLIVHSTGASPMGMFLHHGDWEGRTEYPPQQFWDEVSESGIGDYFFTNPPSGLLEGTLDQLPKGHRNAFDAVVLAIRAEVDQQKGGLG